MKPQEQEYVRQQLIVATADLSGATKGQLQAWLEDAQYETDTHPRKKPRILDEETGKIITLDNPPIPGKQTRAKGSHIPLVQPIEFVTASWRRAVLALEGNASAWLMWCYGDVTRYDHQVEIVRWCWKEFSPELEGKRLAAKTLDRIRSLVWLAAQDVKRELRGRAEGAYQAQQLATLTGVSKSTWSEGYAHHWADMRSHFLALDIIALEEVKKTRSQQKATNFDKSIAKPN